jgi:ABC-2 type transport system permease protein/lipopolysaccharide transport system permease protein
MVLPDTSAIPAEPPADSFYRHRRKMFDSVRGVWAHREIVYTLAERDFRAQYKQATLGILWSLLSPVLTLIVFVFVFARVKTFGSDGIPYALFAFVGILSWNFFSQSLSQGGTSLLSNKVLMAKTQFPRECFPLESMAVTALNSSLGWIPLGLLFIIDQRMPKLATVYAPMLIVIEIAFAAGVTFILSSVIISMRDLAQVIPVLLSLGLFVNPVIWPFSKIPENIQPWFSFFDPVAPVIDNLRRTMLLGHAPDWPLVGYAALGALMYLVGGYKLFKRLEVNFADIA